MMWLARNKDGILHIFREKPSRNHNNTEWAIMNCDYGYPIVDKELMARFSDVTWENSPVAVDITLSMNNFLNKEE